MTQNERQRSGDSELLRREDPKPQTRRHSQRQWQHAKETRASPNVVRLLSEECLLRRDISSLQDSLFRLRALTVLVRLCYQKRLPDIVSRTCHQTMRVMHGRPIFIVLLVIAFLLSAWSNVIAAAFCPRFGSNRTCAGRVVSKPKLVDHQSSCHHEMADMDMDDMQMDTENSSESYNDSGLTFDSELSSSRDQVALDLPVEQCPHCWSHSQPTSGSASLVTTDSSKQSVVTNLLLAHLSFASPATFLNSIT